MASESDIRARLGIHQSVDIVEHALGKALRFFTERDEMNAHIHLAEPRWSPITDLVRAAAQRYEGWRKQAAALAEPMQDDPWERADRLSRMPPLPNPGEPLTAEQRQRLFEEAADTKRPTSRVELQRGERVERVNLGPFTYDAPFVAPYSGFYWFVLESADGRGKVRIIPDHDPLAVGPVGPAGPDGCSDPPGPQGDPYHQPCPACSGSGKVRCVTDWRCVVCGEEISPSIVWFHDEEHLGRVRHAEGSPACRSRELGRRGEDGLVRTS